MNLQMISSEYNQRVNLTEYFENNNPGVYDIWKILIDVFTAIRENKTFMCDCRHIYYDVRQGKVTLTKVADNRHNTYNIVVEFVEEIFCNFKYFGSSTREFAKQYKILFYNDINNHDYNYTTSYEYLVKYLRWIHNRKKDKIICKIMVLTTVVIVELIILSIHVVYK